MFVFQYPGLASWTGSWTRQSSPKQQPGTQINFLQLWRIPIWETECSSGPKKRAVLPVKEMECTLLIASQNAQACDDARTQLVVQSRRHAGDTPLLLSASLYATCVLPTEFSPDPPPPASVTTAVLAQSPSAASTRVPRAPGRALEPTGWSGRRASSHTNGASRNEWILVTVMSPDASPARVAYVRQRHLLSLPSYY